MKAAETRVDRFLASSETAFAIPVYQRNYDWTRVQCQQLFSDILNVGTDETVSRHFIGSIVYVHDDVHFIEGNFDSKNKFERMKVALTELGREEELSVRFAAA